MKSHSVVTAVSLKESEKNGVFVRFEVLTAVKQSISVFWVVTLCGLVGTYQRFGGTQSLRLQV
jgi:hypothetical protein